MSEAQAMTPIDMVLFCPACGVQHIDEPEEALIASGGYLPPEPGDEPWANPPHRSHLCHGCGHIWRPADVPTNGVAAVKTKGAADSALATPGRKIMTSPNTPVDVEAMSGLIDRLNAMAAEPVAASWRDSSVAISGPPLGSALALKQAASALSRLLAERREMLEALKLARVTVVSQVETERYLARKAARAGEYTPDPADTHKSAAVKALDAIDAALSASPEGKGE